MFLPNEFYERDTVTVAKDLIGTFLVTNISRLKPTLVQVTLHRIRLREKPKGTWLCSGLPDRFMSI